MAEKSRQGVKDILKNNRVYFALLGLVFLLGLILRFDMYIFNRSFWFDEAALAINILNNGFFDLFGELKYYQSAPPLFLFETKILVSLFKSSERVFRFIPFLTSLFLLPLFYLFSKYFLSSRAARLLGSFLFAINTNLIFYSGEFKPYALDVFALLSFVLLIFMFKFKRPLLLGVIFALFSWYSYASGIISFSFAIVLFFYVLKNKKHKKDYFLFLLPQIVNLVPLALHFGAIENTRAFMSKIWAWGYIQPDFSNFLTLFTENIFYISHPYKIIFKPLPVLLPLFLGIMCILGGIFLFRGSKIKFFLITSPFFMTLFLSYFGLYPFYDRLSLYLTPIYIILFVKSFEFLLKKPFGSVILLLFLLISIYPTINSQKHMKNLPAQDLAVFLKLKENYKKGDVIILDETSIPQYIYYSKRTGFSADRVLGEKMTKDSTKYLFYLNTLDKNKNYWFVRSSVKFPDVLETREIIEFFGRERGEFKHYNKGKTDLYYVGKKLH